MDINFEWLENTIFKCTLDDDARELLSTLMDIKSFEAGEAIMHQGEQGGTLYILQSGRADVTFNNNGLNMRVASIQSGSLFGEISFLTGDNVSATVTAQNPSTLYSLTRAAYAELMQKNQDLVFAMFTKMLIDTSNTIRHMNKEQASMQQYISGWKV